MERVWLDECGELRPVRGAATWRVGIVSQTTACPSLNIETVAGPFDCGDDGLLCQFGGHAHCVAREAW